MRGISKTRLSVLDHQHISRLRASRSGQGLIWEQTAPSLCRNPTIHKGSSQSNSNSSTQLALLLVVCKKMQKMQALRTNHSLKSLRKPFVTLKDRIVHKICTLQPTKCPRISSRSAMVVTLCSQLSRSAQEKLPQDLVELVQQKIATLSSWELIAQEFHL